MALPVNIRTVYASGSGSLLPGECFVRDSSFWGTRIPSTSRFINCVSKEGWSKGPALKLTRQIFSGGLRVKERDMHVGRFSCRGKVRAGCLGDKMNMLHALTVSDDSSGKSLQHKKILLDRAIVKEIVDNLVDAPFLRYAYFNEAGRNPVRHPLSNDFFEKPGTWGPVRKLLSDASPDGIILVQRLGLVEDLRDKPEFQPKSNVRVRRFDELRGDQSVEEYWGVFVQGFKVHQEECYLLKTTRMLSDFGIVTFFVMIEAETFGPSISTQFVNICRHPYC